MRNATNARLDFVSIVIRADLLSAQVGIDIRQPVRHRGIHFDDFIRIAV